MQTRELGGKRIGSENKMNIAMHGYERSTHDLGKIVKTTMAPGTVVPIYCQVGLPGDTWDINLNAALMTHPTIGPCLGSEQLEIYAFRADMRLYIRALHNNKIGIGNAMSSVYLPQYRVTILNNNEYYTTQTDDIDNAQINPSCILKYLGRSGWGWHKTGAGDDLTRDFNAIPWLMYWDVMKNYYCNKQEEEGVVIHNPYETIVDTIDEINLYTNTAGGAVPIVEAPGSGAVTPDGANNIVISYSGTPPIIEQIQFNTSEGELSLQQLFTSISINLGTITGQFNYGRWGSITINNWFFKQTQPNGIPKLERFPLSDIDDMREAILGASTVSPFIINTADKYPWKYIIDNNFESCPSTQEGLGVKCYKSDILQNWVNTEWIDTVNDASEIDIAASGSILTMDALNLAKKTYDYLMRVAVAGGTYNDWIDVTYDIDGLEVPEIPVFEGGLIKDIIFQEITSLAASADAQNPTQPLGTLAGKGTLGKRHQGGHIRINVGRQACYIMILASITPRIDYSQGNKWDTELRTMDDLHKPAFDQIGFQDSDNALRAWWTETNDNSGVIKTSAGKVPAWLNYMTEKNTNYGNFAAINNEMFMTFNRRYEWNGSFDTPAINDLTTYIDPTKYNYIFAQTSLDAQNYWVQVAIDAEVRRKMSAKSMPVI